MTQFRPRPYSARGTIGGILDYRRLAELHKPSDQDSLHAAAVELQSRGLMPRDIAQALGLSEAAVTVLLERRIRA